MADRHRLNMAKGVRHGESAFTNTTIEIVLMSFVRFTFIKCADILVGVRIFIPILFNRGTSDFTSIDEDSTFGSFKGDSIVTVTGHIHCDAVIESVDHREVMRGVVAIIDGWIPVFVFNWMFAIGTIHTGWTLFGSIPIQCPHRDIDVMSTPVGKFSA